MSIGAGLLGFIGGVAEGGVKASAFKMEEEAQIAKENREALRQKSLQDVARRYKQDQYLRAFEALGDNTYGIESPEELGGLIETGMLEMVIREKDRNRLREETTLRLGRLASRLGLDMSGEDMAAAAEAGILQQLLKEDDTKTFSNEEITALAEEFGTTVPAMNAILRTGSLNAVGSALLSAGRNRSSENLTESELDLFNSFMSGEAPLSANVVAVGRKLGASFEDLYRTRGDSNTKFVGLDRYNLTRIPQLAGLPEPVITALVQNPELQQTFLEDLIKDIGETDSADPALIKPVVMFDVVTGDPLEVPLASVPGLLEETTEGGKQRYFTGKVVEGPDGYVLETPAGIFPIDLDPGETGEPNQLQLLSETLQKSPVANQQMFSKADPFSINPQINIQKARGLLDQAGATARSFGPTAAVLNIAGSKSGESALATQQQLNNLKELSRILGISVVNARSSGAVIAQSDEFSPSTNVLVNMLGSEDSLEIKLKSLRDRAMFYYNTAKNMQSPANRGSLNSNAKSYVAEARMHSENMLRQIDTMIASSKLSNLFVNTDPFTGQQIRPTPLIEIVKTPEQVDELMMISNRNKAAIASGESANSLFTLNQENTALMLLWRGSLLARRGDY